MLLSRTDLCVQSKDQQLHAASKEVGESAAGAASNDQSGGGGKHGHKHKQSESGSRAGLITNSIKLC